MKLGKIVQTAVVAGMALFMLVANASATTIVFNTNSDETGFEGGGLSLDSLFGANATLSFVPNSDTTTGTPSNVNLGVFDLSCIDCTTKTMGIGAHFSPFVFNLWVTDVTDGATGVFVGQSQGGTVYSNASPISIIWGPLQLGPGGDFAQSGDFGGTSFSTTGFTGIVAPNSGATIGRTTVQGRVESIPIVGDTNAIPEPSTLGLAGSIFLGLALLRRRLITRN